MRHPPPGENPRQPDTRIPGACQCRHPVRDDLIPSDSVANHPASRSLRADPGTCPLALRFLERAADVTLANRVFTSVQASRPAQRAASSTDLFRGDAQHFMRSPQLRSVRSSTVSGGCSRRPLSSVRLLPDGVSFPQGGYFTPSGATHSMVAIHSSGSRLAPSSSGRPTSRRSIRWRSHRCSRISIKEKIRPLDDNLKHTTGMNAARRASGSALFPHRRIDRF